MQQDVRIETVREQDVALLLRLIKALAEYERLSGEVVATEPMLRDALFGPAPSAEAALAYVGPDAVGFAVWFYNYSTFVGRPGLYLEDVFVLPDWRGRGIGRALLRHLARIAVARGCGRMEWAVLDWNEPAIRFYHSLGAQAMDGWTVYRLTGNALKQLAGA
ncbi:MAG: GNAT family N-acetyltransferase [Acidobacteria bacterium]|nr:GNAT family N-acetyltransferase [Acidobacteriota bacterium]